MCLKKCCFYYNEQRIYTFTIKKLFIFNTFLGFYVLDIGLNEFFFNKNNQ